MIVIHLARKPLVGTVAGNAVKFGTGGINVDAARITHAEDFSEVQGFASMKLNTRRTGESLEDYAVRVKGGPEQQASLAKLQNLGRWPANTILAHQEGCVRVGTEKDAVPAFKGTGGTAVTCYSDGLFGPKRTGDAVEVGIPVWACVLGCPVKALDAQSGVTVSTGGRIGNASGAFSNLGPSGFTTEHVRGDPGYGDSGGVSRIFKQVGGGT